MAKQTFSKKEYLITVGLKRELVGLEQVVIILAGNPAGVWAYGDVTNGQHTAPKDIIVSVDIGHKPVQAPAGKKTKN